MEVQIAVVEDDFRLALRRAQQERIRLDPAERDLGRLSDDFAQFTGQLKVTLAWHRLDERVSADGSQAAQ